MLRVREGLAEAVTVGRTERVGRGERVGRTEMTKEEEGRGGRGVRLGSLHMNQQCLQYLAHGLTYGGAETLGIGGRLTDGRGGREEADGRGGMPPVGPGIGRVKLGKPGNSGSSGSSGSSSSWGPAATMLMDC